MHITLRFLGNLSQDELCRVSEMLRQQSALMESFEITTGGIGVFPGWKDPKVIWVGLSSGQKEICRLNDRVESFLKDMGFPRNEKRFTPHLTIGRRKGHENIAFLRGVALEASPDPMTARIDHLTLFRSELNSQGAVHTPIELFHFPDSQVSI